MSNFNWRTILFVVAYLTIHLVAASAEAQSVKNLNGECRKLYNRWQKEPGYGAFALAKSGHCTALGYATSVENAISEVLEYCRKQRKAKGCKIIRTNKVAGQRVKNHNLCDREESSSQSLAGCTWLLESGDVKPKTKAWAYRQRARKHISLGKYEVAEQDFNRALELEPGNKFALYWLAEAKRLASSGKLANAKATQRKEGGILGWVEKMPEVAEEKTQLESIYTADDDELAELSADAAASEAAMSKKDKNALAALAGTATVEENAEYKMPHSQICSYALSADRVSWDSSIKFQWHVTEARKRNLTIYQCRSLLGLKAVLPVPPTIQAATSVRFAFLPRLKPKIVQVIAATANAALADQTIVVPSHDDESLKYKRLDSLPAAAAENESANFDANKLLVKESAASAFKDASPTADKTTAKKDRPSPVTDAGIAVVEETIHSGKITDAPKALFPEDLSLVTIVPATGLISNGSGDASGQTVAPGKSSPPPKLSRNEVKAQIPEIFAPRSERTSPNKMENSDVCRLALSNDRKSWERNINWVRFVEEASKRNLTVYMCRSLLGIKTLNANFVSEKVIAKAPLSKPSALGRRVALVIGNGAYSDEVGPLPNPPNDANAMSSALQRLGFEVILLVNGTRSAMNEALYKFATMAEGADSALAFYAGHGIQVDGVNYLIPIDGFVETRADLKHKLVSADALLEEMKPVNGMRMVLLDSCRNNPLSRSLRRKMAAKVDPKLVKPLDRSLEDTKGLAEMRAEGVLIAFATQPNEIAEDDVDSINSPFTTALLKHLETPGIEIDTMFKRVRTEVSAMTDGTQLPQTVNSSVGEFYMMPGGQ